jgi:cysteinyl-tRNA synthetase
MEEARQALNRIDDWLVRLRERAKENVQRPTSNVQHPTSEDSKFEQALDEDLNISGALGNLFEAIRKTNRALDTNAIDAADAKSWLEWWDRINSILEIEQSVPKVRDVSGETGFKGDLQILVIPAEISALAEARVQARLAKNWRKSDELRDELAARGWEARDTKDGQKITRRGGR